MSYSDNYRTEVEVELEREEIYNWVLENCKEELKDDLREEIIEEAEAEWENLDAEDLGRRLEKIASATEDIFIRRALQTALGILQIEKQGQRLRTLEVEREQLRKDLEDLKKARQEDVEHKSELAARGDTHCPTCGVDTDCEHGLAGRWKGVVS